MKKIITLIAFALFLSAGTYAATNPAIPASVSREFGQHFTRAKEVSWETVKDLYKATFSINGKTLFAVYDNKGDLVAVAHNLSPQNLSANLRKEILTTYADFWITDLFSYHSADDHSLFITLESPDRITVLQSVGQDTWTVYRSSVKS